jgi:ADP-ribose pyrophosphatase
MTGRTFTHPSVLQGIADGADWADPREPEEIDWAPRQAAAAIPFKVVNGRPVNPCAKTGIRYGRNKLGHWAEQKAADALVTANGHLLLVERDDGNGWAVPGGYVNPGEVPLRAALRELAEETGLGLLTGDPGIEAMLRELDDEAPLTLAYARPQLLEPLYVDDPRGSDESWMVTYRAVADLGTLPALPAVRGRDDARRAEWIPCRNYTVLAAALDMLHGRVFAAHVDMLAGFLDGGTQ